MTAVDVETASIRSLFGFSWHSGQVFYVSGQINDKSLSEGRQFPMSRHYLAQKSPAHFKSLRKV